MGKKDHFDGDGIGAATRGASDSMAKMATKECSIKYTRLALNFQCLCGSQAKKHEDNLVLVHTIMHNSFVSVRVLFHAVAIYINLLF
jgi:hypothetical protein